MRYFIIACLCIVLLFSCTHSRVHKIDLKELNQDITELEGIAQNVVLQYIAEISQDSLHNAILKRYAYKDFYSIEFLQSVDTFEYEIVTIPYFTLCFDSVNPGAYALIREPYHIKCFLINNNLPFAEVNFDFDNRRNKYSLDYIQGIRKTTWLHYNDKIEQGYPVFMCNIKIDEPTMQGHVFLPYIFYVNGEDEIIAHSWLKNFELSMDEVVQKHLK